jgi:hypothetical protein
MPPKGYRSPRIDPEKLLDAAAVILRELQGLQPTSVGLAMALSGIELARRKTAPPPDEAPA